MRIEYCAQKETFTAYCKFEERFKFLTGGWEWDSVIKKWTTVYADKVKPFYESCDDPAKKAVEDYVSRKLKLVEASRKASTDKVFKAPEGLSFFPYQNAGIEFAVERKDCLIADAPGLGKTPQTVGVMNTTKPRKTLVVCPASLKVNWYREVNKWSIRDLKVHVVDSKWDETADVIIINFELLAKYYSELREITWDLLVVDECHKIKNSKAKRTQQVYGGGYGSKRTKPLRSHRRLWLTGTPILNKPIDLFPMCKAFDRDGLGKDWERFVMRYCNGTETNFGLDSSGASHLDELQFKLRSTFMIRRLKKDVLKELPPKTRQVFQLPKKGLVKILNKELEVFDQNIALLEGLNESFSEEERISPLDAMEYIRELTGDSMSDKVENLMKVDGLMFESSAITRKELALGKVPMCVEYIKELKEGEGIDKVLIFAHHKEVIEKLKEAFPNHAIITGDIPVPKRQAEVDKFQNDPEITEFIGQLDAAGEGHTLTAGYHVICLEFCWVPAIMCQVEDRAHRIGQTGNVHIHYLVVEDSLEANMILDLIAKEEIIEEALDEETYDELRQHCDKAGNSK